MTRTRTPPRRASASTASTARSSPCRDRWERRLRKEAAGPRSAAEASPGRCLGRRGGVSRRRRRDTREARAPVRAVRRRVRTRRPGRGRPVVRGGADSRARGGAAETAAGVEPVVQPHEPSREPPRGGGPARRVRRVLQTLRGRRRVLRVREDRRRRDAPDRSLEPGPPARARTQPELDRVRVRGAGGRPPRDRAAVDVARGRIAARLPGEAARASESESREKRSSTPGGKRGGEGGENTIDDAFTFEVAVLPCPLGRDAVRLAGAQISEVAALARVPPRRLARRATRSSAASCLCAPRRTSRSPPPRRGRSPGCSWRRTPTCTPRTAARPWAPRSRTRSGWGTSRMTRTILARRRITLGSRRRSSGPRASRTGGSSRTRRAEAKARRRSSWPMTTGRTLARAWTVTVTVTKTAALNARRSRSRTGSIPRRGSATRRCATGGSCT